MQDVQKREHAHKLALMARSSKAAIGTDGNGNGNENAVIEKLKFDLSRYKDRCRSYLAELESLKKPEIPMADGSLATAAEVIRAPDLNVFTGWRKR